MSRSKETWRIAAGFPSPAPLAPLGKVARSAGWGVARCFNPELDCTGVTANLLRPIPAFHTPSAATRRLPHFAEKGGDADPPERARCPTA